MGECIFKARAQILGATDLIGEDMPTLTPGFYKSINLRIKILLIS